MEKRSKMNSKVVGISKNFDWGSVYLLPRKCTLSKKLKNFPLKFFHRRFTTNSFLFTLQAADTDLSKKPKKRTAHSLLLELAWHKCFGIMLKNSWFHGASGLFQKINVYLLGKEGDILVSRCLLLAICWPYQRVTELTRLFFTKKCMAVLPGGQNNVLVITRWPYNWRGFHCTSIALEKCKKRMRYCSNYSGTTLLSIKKWNYSISWWIAFC